MGYPKLKSKYREEALFSPRDFLRYKNIPSRIRSNIPKKYVITYQQGALSYFRQKYKPRKMEIYSLLTIYKHKDIGFVKMTGIGSPNAAGVFEELIALGGREFINVGTVGGLHSQGIFICNRALRDEGTSYHYIPHGHFSYPDKGLTERLYIAIINKGLKFSRGTTWTIDAPYRETKKEVEKYTKAGISTVDMEAAALFAVAKYRKVRIASVFVVSDLLGKKWLPKFHRFDIKKAQNLLIDAAVECLRRR